jgi:hypothetical protein
MCTMYMYVVMQETCHPYLNEEQSYYLGDTEVDFVSMPPCPL